MTMPVMDTATLTILKALLNAKDGVVSGNFLTRKLGIGQVDICSRMEELCSQGFEFEAVGHKGYRLTKKPDCLNAWLTAAYLDGEEDVPELIFLSSIDSTNDHATRLLARHYDAPFFVVSNEQTNGRGRMGRKWYSPPSRNLYLTFASRPQFELDRIQRFTLWMGACIASHLRDWLDVKIGLKWPNDLYFEGKKLGGMLTEARGDADTVCELVFGVGLNVNQQKEDWPIELRNTATSLREIIGNSLDLNRCSAQLIQSILAGYRQFAHGSIRHTFEELWPPLDVLQSKSIKAEVRGEVVSGIASGLDDRGSLIVKTVSGKLITLSSGEVHIATMG